jgi:hypothetical protein
MPTVKKQNLLLAAFAVLIVIFGSISAFELVKGPTSTTITSSTTFTTTTIVLSNVTITETETVEHYITNQFYRTTSLTTAFTTSFPYWFPFVAKAGDVLVSTWVIENGIMLNVTCTPFFKAGDTFNYFITMTNINNTSHLSITNFGELNVTIYNSNGHAIYSIWYIYATGPPGPPIPSLSEGAEWDQVSYWDTETNSPNDLGPGSPPAIPPPGNYTMVTQGSYLNIDLNEMEYIELLMPLTIR